MAISRLPWPVGKTRTNVAGLGRFELLTAPNVSYDPGALVVCPAGSVLAQIPNPAAPSPAQRLMGTFVGTTVFTSGSSTDPVTGGALDPNTGQLQKITVQPLSSEGTVDFATGTGANQITAANIDGPAFVFDNDTFYPTDLGGTLPWGGWVGDVDANSGRVTIKHSALLRVFWEAFSAGQATPGVTTDGYARLVATSIPAGTFSGGVFTVTAPGAFPTQDGVAGPLNVGDVLVFPLGTVGTQAVSAANSGPWEATVIGATGVQPVFTRPAWWAHAAKIKPNGTVRVGGEGTTYKSTSWVAKPATAGKVVDTDDPLMFPAEMIVPLTLASGTHAPVATIPLRAAGLFAILFEWTGGSPAATATSIQATTQTPGGIGTASIVPFECVTLGTTVGTGSATCNLIVRQ